MRFTVTTFGCVFTEASIVLRAVAADFFFNCWCLEIPSDNCIQHVPKMHPLSCSKLSIGRVLCWNCNIAMVMNMHTSVKDCFLFGPP
jgi:hypothetical protein